jgi:hypothetical protein
LYTLAFHDHPLAVSTDLCFHLQSGARLTLRKENPIHPETPIHPRTQNGAD